MESVIRDVHLVGTVRNFHHIITGKVGRLERARSPPWHVIATAEVINSSIEAQSLRPSGSLV